MDILFFVSPPISRPLSLAAGTIPIGTPADAVRTAAASGYPMVGLRPGPERCDPTHAQLVARLASDLGVAVLDVEVVRIGTTRADDMRRLVDFAVMAGATHLLSVSYDVNRHRTVDAFRALCEWTSGTGLRPVLEFQPFSAVADLAAALSIVREVGDGGVVVDALHLARSGGTVSEVASNNALVPYLHLCDALALARPHSVDALAEEARHHRLLPGMGDLPLETLLAAVPTVPASAEVPSDEGWARSTPVTWALDVRKAAEAVIAAVPAQ